MTLPVASALSHVTVLSRARDPMLLLDAAGTCVYANQAASDLLGAGEALEGRSFASLLLEAGDGGPFHARLPTATHDVMVDVEATVTHEVLPHRHLVVLRRRKPSSSLSEAVSAALFEGAPCGVLVVGVHGGERRCIAVNGAMSRLGLVRGLPEGRRVEDACIRSVAQAVRDAHEECSITHAPHSAEHIFDIAGRETWWLVSSTPVYEHGTLVHLVCSFFYVDFLKRTEQELRQTDESFRELVERIPDAVLLVARQGVIHANSTALVLLGYPSIEGVIGEDAMKWVHPADRARVREGWRSKTRKLVDARILRSDGTERSAEIVAMPVVVGGRACVLALVRDTTERNELRARLVQADRTIALGTLAGGVAHEINTPLSYVSMNVAYVREQLASANAPPDLLNALDDALTGADRVARIVRELRALAKGDTRSIGPVDLKKTIESVLKLVRGMVEQRAKLIMEIDDVGMVRGCELLGQVFLNLLVNAAQAIPAGKPGSNEVRIFAATRDERWVVVGVEDTGPGIDAKHIHRIFDPFFTTKAPGEGMGLGLALAQRVVEACGGRISARSAPTRGAVFEVWLLRELSATA